MFLHLPSDIFLHVGRWEVKEPFWAVCRRDWISCFRGAAFLESQENRSRARALFCSLKDILLIIFSLILLTSVQTTITSSAMAQANERPIGTLSPVMRTFGANAYQLSCRYWYPDSREVVIRGLVILVHGLAEKTSVYLKLAIKLQYENFLVFGHDHVGHGGSEGKRGYVDSIDDYVRDVKAHIEEKRRENPGVPVFAVGNSMGGMILLSGLLNETPDLHLNLDGVVLLSPLIDVSQDLSSWFLPQPWLIERTQQFSSSFGYNTSNYLNAKYITSDPVHQNELAQYGPTTRTLATAVSQCAAELKGKLEQVNVAFLVLHAKRDRLCNIQGSDDLFNKARTASTHKKIVRIEGNQHYLYRSSSPNKRVEQNPFETTHGRVEDETIAFICEHAPSPEASV